MVRIFTYSRIEIFLIHLSQLRVKSFWGMGRQIHLSRALEQLNVFVGIDLQSILHIEYLGRGLQSIFEHGLFIQFPTFKTKAIIVNDDIYLNATSLNTNNDSFNAPMFESSAQFVDLSSSSFFRNVKLLQSGIQYGAKKVDNLLRDYVLYIKSYFMNLYHLEKIRILSSHHNQ